MTKTVRAAVEQIDEQAWTKIENYPEDGEAQIAETVYGDRRLIVRRTRLLGAQAELWPDWRHFPILTNRTEPLGEVEAEHRDHAVVEQVIADLKAVMAGRPPRTDGNRHAATGPIATTRGRPYPAGCSKSPCSFACSGVLRRRISSSELRALSLPELASRHVASWRPVYERAGRRLHAEIGGPVTGLASAGAVGQALDVLLENALRHVAGPVVVRVDERDGQPGLAVLDAGDGVPAGSEAAIFERGSSLGGGSGVGLHLARALVEAEGGRLTLVRARPPEFDLRLAHRHPARPRLLTPPRPLRSDPRPPAGGRARR